MFLPIFRDQCSKPFWNIFIEFYSWNSNLLSNDKCIPLVIQFKIQIFLEISSLSLSLVVHLFFYSYDKNLLSFLVKSFSIRIEFSVYTIFKNIIKNRNKRSFFAEKYNAFTSILNSLCSSIDEPLDTFFLSIMKDPWKPKNRRKERQTNNTKHEAISILLFFQFRLKFLRIANLTAKKYIYINIEGRLKYLLYHEMIMYILLTGKSVRLTCSRKLGPSVIVMFYEDTRGRETREERGEWFIGEIL